MRLLDTSRLYISYDSTLFRAFQHDLFGCLFALIGRFVLLLDIPHAILELQRRLFQGCHIRMIVRRLNNITAFRITLSTPLLLFIFAIPIFIVAFRVSFIRDLSSI